VDVIKKKTTDVASQHSLETATVIREVELISQFAIEHGPFIVDLPIEHGDFP
jgi:hypothetical protein